MAGPVTAQSIVIGLDFGTTYSGAAWVITGEQPDIEVVSTWPGGGNQTSVKVPTVVAFSENRFLWGWQALASSQEPIRGVKLLLEELLGFQAFELLPERNRNAALRYWQESIKLQFTGPDLEDGQDDVGWEVLLPGLPDQPLIELEGGFLRLSKSQVQGLFDPVVQDVIKFVQDQVRKIKIAGLSARAILLVGGFGGSEYVYRRLCIANPKITIMQPPNAWQAVVCGAV